MTNATTKQHSDPVDDSSRPHQLAELDLTPLTHFQVNVHAAVFRVVDHLQRSTSGLEAALERHPFLIGYLDAAMPYVPIGHSWEDTHRWWIDEITAWESTAAADLPLCRLSDRLGITPIGRTLFILSGLVEEDSRFAQVFAAISGEHRPSFEALVAFSSPRLADDGAVASATLRQLIDKGLINVSNPDAARSQWWLRPNQDVWDVVTGVVGRTAGHVPSGDLPRFEDVVVPDELASRCRRVGVALDEINLVVVRGAIGSDRLDLVGAIIGSTGRGTITVAANRLTDGSWPAVGPLAVAIDAVPVVVLDLAPGETVEIPRPPGLVGPIVAVVGSTGGIDGQSHDKAISIEFPRLDRAGRMRRWAAALGDHPVSNLDEIAGACGLQGAHIGRVAESAVALAHLDDVEAITLSHVRAAASELNRQLLDTLAARLDVAGDWTDVVVGDFTAHKLDELEARCRHRESLGASLGAAYDQGTGIGVRAMFTGASGTGKTLAAKILGNRLGLDVHRVDLAAIVNKYIGETEKNLHRVLTTAEELDVVLLIDEGDSLLGRRTDVRSSNDRFANLETNYLLQRLEHYRGIVVVTTNAAEHIDTAFQRRMDVVVNFLPPTPRERAEIWRLHLPLEHRVDDALIVEISQRCTMTGGQIRNAVLHATLLAVGERQQVSSRHLEQAVASEYQKAGASSPYDPSGRRQTVSHARSFQQVIS